MMKKKSTLSNTSSTSSTGNMQSNQSQSTQSFLAQQGYIKKNGCGCGKNG